MVLWLIDRLNDVGSRDGVTQAGLDILFDYLQMVVTPFAGAEIAHGGHDALIVLSVVVGSKKVSYLVNDEDGPRSGSFPLTGRGYELRGRRLECAPRK